MKDKTGLIRILAALHDTDCTFTDAKQRSGLSNGTTQRRLRELEEAGIVETTPEFRDDHAVKVYSLNDPIIGAHAYILEDKLDL